MRTLVILLLLGAAAAGGYLVARNPFSTGDIQAPPPAIVAPVEHRTLRETLDVRGEVVDARRWNIRAERGGRVTRVRLRADRVVRPGQAVIDVDGRPQVVVAGQFPFWRKLSSGSRGRDVRQLQRLLARDGAYEHRIDGVFGPATSAALRAWQRRHGFPADAVLRQGDLIVADVPARVGAVKVAIGDRLAADDVVAVLTAGRQMVEVDLDAAQRARARVGQPVEVELSGTGRPTAGRIVRIADVPVRRDNDDDGVVFPTRIKVDEPLNDLVGAPVSVAIVIADAPDATAVPLAAVGMDADGHAIVQVRVGRDGLRPVRINTGIIDGGHIEARGLDGIESVVVEAP